MPSKEKPPIFETNRKKVIFGTLPLIAIIVTLVFLGIYIKPNTIQNPTPQPVQISIQQPSPDTKPILNATSSSTTQIDKPVAILLLNGTSKKGLASKYAEIIKKDFPKFTTSTGNTKGDGYKNSLIVPANEDAKTQAEQISKSLDFKIGILPEDEKKPDEDIMVILGQDVIE